jgi:peptidoglycan/LPS O-acetylase OafA/YrhL
MITPKNRLRELDFLRGIAILLVLMRHQLLFGFTKTMGWIGVDLFFVLSGFLVSGLLFKEYQKFGNIKPKLFLIRRGFKIYPLYFLTYLLYLTPILIKKKLEWNGFLSDLFFVQNYVNGWGYAYSASWSLAVEEHFYFGLTLLLWLGIKRNIFNFNVPLNSNVVSKFEYFIIIILITCFCLRVVNAIYFPELTSKNITMTHLRIDSLLAGVFVSYWYYFKNELLKKFFTSYKSLLVIISILLLLFTPFKDQLNSTFVKTIGFSMLYISFSIILIYFLLQENINQLLNKVFTPKIVNFVCKIGFSSYSIYIIHTFVNYIFNLINTILFKSNINQFILFFTTSLISIFTGIFMTMYVEKYFLKIRDKKYPSRIV